MKPAPRSPEAEHSAVLTLAAAPTPETADEDSALLQARIIASPSPADDENTSLLHRSTDDEHRNAQPRVPNSINDDDENKPLLKQSGDDNNQTSNSEVDPDDERRFMRVWDCCVLM